MFSVWLSAAPACPTIIASLRDAAGAPTGPASGEAIPQGARHAYYTRWPGDEGYDRMNFARATGWEPISSWGLDGWDLGSWPLVVVYHRGDTHLAIDVEGDITVETFSGRDERDRRTDETAFFYWKNHDEEWVKGLDSHEQMPANLRGPFSWKRLDDQRARREKEAA